MKVVFKTVVIMIASASLLGGCLYSFSGSSLPSHIKTIAVPSFENESLDARIADEATEGIQENFLSDNRLKVVREAQADCVLEGKITGYERRVYSYTASQEPEEYIVVVTIACVLKDRVKNKDLWGSDRLEATATYDATGGSIAGAGGSDGAVFASEEEARTEAIKLLAQDILAKALEQW